jgi:hypothetical protein
MSDQSAACHSCGRPRAGVLQVHPSDRHTTEPLSRAASAATIWLIAKVGCILLASLLAAAILWHHEYGELRLEWFVAKAILRDAETNFALAMLISLIPRSTGLLLALLVLGTRTYLAWQAAGIPI